MSRARRDRGRGPSRWWRSVEAIAMGSALASGLFGIFAALEWSGGAPGTNPIATVAGLAIVAAATWRIGRTAKRRAEAIEADERKRKTASANIAPIGENAGVTTLSKNEQKTGEHRGESNPREGEHK